MENQKFNAWQDPVKIWGFVFLAASLLVYAMPWFRFIHITNDTETGIFAWVYFLSIVYFIIVFVQFNRNKRKFSMQVIENILISCLLFTISCFAFNRIMEIFSEMTAWTSVALFLMGASTIALLFRKHLHTAVNLSLVFLLGIFAILCLYFAVCLFPSYIYALVGFWVIGLPLLLLVPLLLVVFFIVFVMKLKKENHFYQMSFLAGVSMALMITVVFIYKWNRCGNRVMEEYSNTFLEQDDVLPAWVRISSRLDLNIFTEKYLKAGLEYETANRLGSGGFMNSMTNFSGGSRHDPLVVVANRLGVPSELSAGEKMKILESLYNCRHQAEERLWNGKDLRTNSIATNVILYPGYRMSYTEKTISIGSVSAQNSFPEEAIYTFYLPEGATVTSLSLWINGKEEKAHLSSRNKADSAYKTIVGHEVRDPSLVHWQEGNSVSVRVFPCTPSENRRFRIGITSPLQISGERLVYQSIPFDGPSSVKTRETVKISSPENQGPLVAPAGFRHTGRNSLYDGIYRPGWSVSMPLPKINPGIFYFDHSAYQVTAYHREYETFVPGEIWFDINRAWTKTEFEKLVKMFEKYNVYVWNDGKVKLDENNRGELFNELSLLNFSIFPFTGIQQPLKTIVITKCSMSPGLNDLNDSRFYSEIKKFFLLNSGIRVYDLGEQPGAYMKALKELRVITMDQGNPDKLSRLLAEKKFLLRMETDSMIEIPSAGIVIRKSGGDGKSNAPDHLARLFVYNDVMKKLGMKYSLNDNPDEKIIDEAGLGNVVTPVSSLVVLETERDYRNFDIPKHSNSLENASAHGKGAVPEPGEWVLIIVMAIMIVVLWRRFY